MKISGLSDSPFFIKNLTKSNKLIEEESSKTNHKQDDLEQFIFYSVLKVGKVAATYRFTKYEKKELKKIIFSMQMKNIFISENLLIRIAVKNLLCDYERKSNRSILHRVAFRLNHIPSTKST